MTRKQAFAGLCAAVFAAVAAPVSAASAAPASVPCNGPMGAATVGSVYAEQGCDLTGTTVDGNVTIDPNGSLYASAGTTIAGSVTGIGLTGQPSGYLAFTVYLRGASIHGSITISGADDASPFEVEIIGTSLTARATVGGNVALSNIPASPSNAVAGLTIGGNVTLNGFEAMADVVNLTVSSDAIGGSLSITNNTDVTGDGGVSVLNNTIAGGMTFSNNEFRLNQQATSVGGNGVYQNNTAVTEVDRNQFAHQLQCTGNTIILGFGNTYAKATGQCVGF